MALLSSLKNLLFQEVEGVVVDLRTGTAGVQVKNDEGEVIVTFVDKGEEGFELESNPIKELGMPVPAYAVRTAPDKIKKGDIVVLNDGTVAFFVRTAGKSKIDIVNAKSGREGQISLSKNQLLGSYGVLAVANILNPAGGGDFNSLLPFLLLKEGGKDNNKLLLFMMMQQGGQLAGGMGNLLPLLLLGGEKGGSSDALMLMAMSGQGGLGGSGLTGLLPFLLADGKDKAPAAAPVKKAAG